MKRIFIGGHGRCTPGLYKTVPDRVTIMWFGEIKQSVKKGYTKAVLRGQIDEIGDAGAQGTYSEHYLCETLELEAVARVLAFQAGPWDANTYFVQCKQFVNVALSMFISYAKNRWPGEDLEIRWAVCRSSTIGGGVLTHDITGGGIKTVKMSDGHAARDPGQYLLNNIADIKDENVWITQWRNDLCVDMFSNMPASSF
jgi:hypothetical protein